MWDFSISPILIITKYFKEIRFTDKLLYGLIISIFYHQIFL